MFEVELQKMQEKMDNMRQDMGKLLEGELA